MAIDMGLPTREQNVMDKWGAIDVDMVHEATTLLALGALKVRGSTLSDKEGSARKQEALDANT